MITAWPTVSPVNVSAAIGLAESLGPQTATILGAVAVGVLGVALVVGAVIYFKKGGSVSGLVEKVKANKGLITKAASMLPLTEEQKAKVNAAVNDPTSLLPEQAQQAINVIQHAKEYEAAAIASLPISEEQKAQLTSVVTSVHDKVVKKAEATPTGVQLKKLLKPTDLKSSVSESKTVTVVPVSEVKEETKKTKETKPKEVKEVNVREEKKEIKEVKVESEIKEATEEVGETKETEEAEEIKEPKEVAPTLVALHISEADMEAVKAFLAEKEISHA